MERNIKASRSAFHLSSGNIAITPTSGGGTGGGGGNEGGGGGGGCFSKNTLLKIMRDGSLLHLPFSDVRADDLMFTARRTWRGIRSIITHDGVWQVIDMGNGELVTTDDLIKMDEHWSAASEAFAGDVQNYTGTVMTLSIDSDDYEEQSFALSNGRFAHNKFLQ